MTKRTRQTHSAGFKPRMALAARDWAPNQAPSKGASNPVIVLPALANERGPHRRVASFP